MRRTSSRAPLPRLPGRASGRPLRTATVVTVVVIALSGCADDEASPGMSSGEAAATPPPAPSFADPTALADALGCADTFVDEMPGGREGINHAECEVDGQPVELYVLDDDVPFPDLVILDIVLLCQKHTLFKGHEQSDHGQ